MPGSNYLSQCRVLRLAVCAVILALIAYIGWLQLAENEEMNAPLEEEQEKAPAQKKETAKKPGLFVRIGRRLKKVWSDYKSEMKKVVWMPWKDVKKNTVLVLSATVALGLLIGLVDFVCSEILGGIAGLVG